MSSIPENRGTAGTVRPSPCSASLSHATASSTVASSVSASSGDWKRGLASTPPSLSWPSGLTVYRRSRASTLPNSSAS